MKVYVVANLKGGVGREIKREQTQEQRTEKDSMYELSAKNDRLILNSRKDVS